MFKALTTRISDLKKQRKEPYEIFLKYTWEEISAYVYAYAERLAVQSCLKVLSNLKDPEHIRELTNLFIISTLENIINNMAFYGYANLIPANVAQDLTRFRSEMIREAAKTVELLVHKTANPEHANNSPISRPDWFKSLENLPVNNYVPPRL